MNDQQGHSPAGGGPPPPPPGRHPDQPNYTEQQPNYPQPYRGPPPQYGYPQTYVPQPPNNGYAIASLICSIIGVLFLLPVIGPILGIVFGNMAKKQIAESQGREGGENLAQAGVVLGWIGIVLNILIAGAILALFVGALAFLSGTAEVFENLPTPTPSP